MILAQSLNWPEAFAVAIGWVVIGFAIWRVTK